MTARLTAAESTTVAFDVLSSASRRYLLSALLDRDESTPASLSTLATEVAARERGRPIVSDERCRRSHLQLVHVDVPKLVEVGVLERASGENAAADSPRADRGVADAVALAAHPILEQEWVRTLLERPAGSVCDEPLLDRTLEALRPARRRRIIAVLAGRRGPVHVHDLATMAVARARGVRLVEVAESDSAGLAAALVHRDLPALANVGVVDFDGETAAIAPDAVQFDAEWLLESPIGSAIEPLWSVETRDTDGSQVNSGVDPAAPEADACWTLEGPAPILQRGYQLADEAESELFVTVPDAGSIQRRCLNRWAAAVERGVDVYVGSRSSRVRELAGTAHSGITVCEPRFDWVNLPIERVDPGRVVFADRDGVMLVTIDRSGGELRPTAITGSGSENALVRLVRDHLGPRLDRLATESEDAEREGSAIPLPM
ncbi:DUF7344 domain-containing protein [Halosolutus gelatinilyticus]|uniref:DUF7344 domain-containing protein n=1 Tax=Halosolutus gelatinilyticus TaxID=2931975 RepID=UPI001FF159A6|nr:hypothetical protein [Halosolutus gelatinilyticus]